MIPGHVVLYPYHKDLSTVFLAVVHVLASFVLFFIFNWVKTSCVTTSIQCYLEQAFL